MTKKSLILVISGPSGVGKKTVIKELVKMDPTLLVSISATTRKPRTGETDGVDYFFLTEQDFKEKIDQYQFIEWAKVHGNYYGTLKANFLQAKNLNTHLIMEIDVQGGKAIKKAYPKDSLLIFLLPPTFSDLEKRIRLRGTETEEQIMKRLETAKLELLQAKEYDYKVINSDPKQAAIEIVSHIKGRLMT